MDAEQLRQHWKYRTIKETQGNLSFLGTVLLGVLGKMSRRPPWVGNKAVIQANGSVSAPYMSRLGAFSPNAVLFDSVDDLTGQFSRLADDLKLPDEDRIALFREIKLWCHRDLREKPENLTFHATRKTR